MTTSGKEPTSQKTTNSLVLYRLEQVEAAVRDVSDKLDQQENIKKADLTEFKDAILNRFNEVRLDLQKQIDSKADSRELKDVKRLIAGIATAFGSIITALVIYYLTTGRGGQ